MLSVLIIVTSSTIRKSFGNRMYNEQEVGLAKALIRKGYKASIAYYGRDKELHDYLDFGDGVIEMYLFRGCDFLKTSIFRNYEKIYEKYDVLMPISYDHYESFHIAMKYPEKTIIYHGTYYASFNKRYNLKCSVVDPIILRGYKKKETPFITKNRLAATFLNNKGIMNTRVVGVGFDKEQMASDEMIESELSGKIMEYKKTGKILLYVGRIEPRRNITFLIKVFHQIKKSNNVRLIIIGGGREKYLDICKKLVKNLDLQDDVLFFGKVEQRYLPMIYKLSDLFILPTSYEIFGMVLLEAMYYGVPVLTTLNGGSDLLIRDGHTGFLIQSLNIIEWSKKIVDILNCNNERVIKDAHDFINNYYVWDVLVDKFIDSFNNLVYSYNS